MTAILYVGLAVATVGVLGSAAVSKVPLADLIRHGFAGPAASVTAVLAVLLTVGTMNAYVAGAVNLVEALQAERLLPGVGASVYTRRGPLAVLGLVGLILLALMAAKAITIAGLVSLVGSFFVAVYVLSVSAAVRVLAGRARVWAWTALPFTVLLLVLSRGYIAGPLVVGAAAAAYGQRRRSHA